MSRTSARRARHAKACQGKTPHASQQAAHDALQSLIRTRGATPYGTGVYKCTACGSWHWGHLPKGRHR